MTTRTYRINLVGEPEHTGRALEALDALFGGEALALLRERLAADGLSVQHLVADASEVVLYITPLPSEPEASPDEEPLSREIEAGFAASGGGMGGEEPPR